MRLPRQVLSALTCAALLYGCSSSPAQVAPAGGVSSAPQAAAFSTLVASRSATVVDISTLRIGRDESEGDMSLEFAPENDFADRLAWPLPASARISQIRDLASGIIISSDGFILTSAHVVAQVDEAQVRLDDGRRFIARLVGSDRQTDVALLKIDAEELPVAVIGDSSRLSPGDWVAAIGAPFGFHGSVTSGVVSAKDRLIAGAGEIPFIQTDVAINPGSSGSPLFNGRGEVVAVNSMIYSGSGGYMGLSFAVPINLAMHIAAQLRATGLVRRARLGAELQEMTPLLAESFGLAQPTGALVVNVEPDGPARRSGLAAGDIVTAIDGVRFSHFSELLQQIAERTPGTRSRLDLWRRGETHTLWVTLSEQSGTRIPPASNSAPEWNDGLGLSLGELSAGTRQQLRIDAGLLVRESSGLARSEGIRAGDLIVAVNDKRLERVDDFRRALSGVTAGGTVALLVMRDRRLAYVPVRISARPASH
ncbi:putative periplasmic serine endoprotease DegP-like precursor [Variovorax sp. PBS-H4]|uniref:trypsin-like peptidase domain-containing protein n=1 Tax=Variovorax sp. PBS-H4 TaxID=434008 RepID=UPI001315EF59|nr:trypsin-like peptidase domain-containing protein [Variovorax sp. PBS-H4]VTU36377.1 putative periplasmic serine endoprotease DegP-like precursor [Variovorax sp. PBS-H4]